MPATKNAFIRYMIIARELRLASSTHPKSKSDLQRVIREEIGVSISSSQIDKDIYAMRYDSELGINAPILANHPMKMGQGRGKWDHGSSGYYMEPGYDFFETIKKTWGL